MSPTSITTTLIQCISRCYGIRSWILHATWLKIRSEDVIRINSPWKSILPRLSMRSTPPRKGSCLSPGFFLHFYNYQSSSEYQEQHFKSHVPILHTYMHHRECKSSHYLPQGLVVQDVSQSY